MGVFVFIPIPIIAESFRWTGTASRARWNQRQGHSTFADAIRSLNAKRTNKMAENKLSDIVQKAVLTSAEAAAYLGVSLQTLHKWTMARAIPFSKPNGKLCYFDRLELERWAMSGRVSTDDEIKARAQAYCQKGGGR